MYNFYPQIIAPPPGRAKKILLVMKLTTLLLITAILQVSASSFAQKISLSEHNATLDKVFEKISNQTGFDFLFSTSILKQAAPVNIQVSNEELDAVLKKIFQNQPLAYSIQDRSVVISQKQPGLLDKLETLFARFAASHDIRGVVSDDSGPLAGVSIRLKGTDRATITDNNGAFFLNNVQENAIIVFSYIGYKSQEVTVNSGTTYKIKLEKNVAGLNDVVVIGYGTSQRKDLTGSVSTIAVKDVQDIPFGTIDNALAGKAAGVEVTKTDGSPGGAVRIRIRGSSSILGGNDPLYVIDDVPVQVQSNFLQPGYDISGPAANDVNSAGGLSSSLSTAFVNGLNSLGGLNIDDIESISILKDASSTAIYGSKAANGVVIITTKKGKKEMKPVITASYYTTTTTPITPHVLNASQYKMLLTEAAKNDLAVHQLAGDDPSDQVNAILNDPDFFGKANTNWIKEVTRTTVSNNVEVSVQGGGNSSKYFNSISYNSTPGVINGTDYQRLSGKINFENEIGPKFRIITNMIIGYTNQNIGDGAYGQALRARPDYTPYDAAGNPTDFSQVGFAYQGFQNPVALLKATNNARTFNLLGSLSAIYAITRNLQFKSTASLNMQAYNQRNYTPSYLSIGSFYDNVINNGGIGSNSNSRLTNWFVENTLTYNKAINDKNTINVLAGTSYETRKTSFFSATATGYPNDDVLTSLSSAVTPLLVRGDDPTGPQSYLLSFYVRANYAYMDKYLFTFTGRSDGSSKFGPDNKFGYFPSGAIAWRISKENFLKNVKWISDLKLRGSYGLTGTQNIGDQMYRTLFTPASYNGASALIPTQLGNEGIKWESTREADGGLDISLFDDRLQLTADYYNKKTSGALLSLPIAPSSSYPSLLSNAVGIKNTGVEVSLSGDIIRTKDFKWNASVNVTWNNSMVTKLSANADLSQIPTLSGLEYNNTTLVQGKPLGLLTGLHVTGIIKTQAQLDAYKKLLGVNALYSFPYLGIGDPMYELDITGPTDNNVKFNAIIGNAAPKYYGGITQGFTYKNFGLQLYFTFSEGGKLVWGDHISSVEFEGTSNANVAMLQRYTPTNTNTGMPRLLLGYDNFYYQSNLDVFSSSYLKLRTLTFNYHFDKTDWMKRAGMQSVSLFVSATNLFTITKYPGNDPETSDDSYSVAGGYLDVSNYPAVRTLSAGVKIGF